MSLLWSMDPPGTRTVMTCIPLHKTWQMNLLWWMDPPAVAEQRWLVYHYTKLGRWNYFGQWTLWVPQQGWLACHYKKLGGWTYFGQWPPRYQSRDNLHTSIENLADEPTLADEPPRYHSRDDLHTTTSNLADEPTLANGPPTSNQSRDDLHTHYTKLGRWTYFGQWTRQVPEQRWLAYQCTKLGRWTYFDQWTPLPGTRAETTCIPLQKTWQMSLLGPLDSPPVAEQRWLAYHYTKLGRWTYFGQ